MTEVSTIGLDVAKQVFHAHGADAAGATVFSRRITRQKLIQFFASQPESGHQLSIFSRPLLRVGSGHRITSHGRFIAPLNLLDHLSRMSILRIELEGAAIAGDCICRP